MQPPGGKLFAESREEERMNHSGHGDFYDYYARESQTAEALRRFRAIRDAVLMVWRRQADPRPLDVADIGCGAGTLSMIWAEAGHRVHGLEINRPLLDLARRRARDQGLDIDFREGSAVAFPWDDKSMDVCLLPELLEHVPDWRACVQECARVLKPGGILYLTTTNRLCPVQQEFSLPLYSWYPRFAKRFFESMAVTRWRSLVNHATYPAVNWFTFYELRRELGRLGFDRCLDRFELIRFSRRSSPARFVLACVRKIPPLRWLGHVATPYTKIIAIKNFHPPAYTNRY